MPSNDQLGLKYAGWILLLVMPLLNVMAQGDYPAMRNVEGFRQQMERTALNTSSIQSGFIQLKHLSFLEEDVESEGQFYYKKHNLLRWEYSRPFFYLIIFSGDTIIIQDEHKVNVYNTASGRMFAEINDIMLGMVDGSILQRDNFSFAYFESPSSYILELSPDESNIKEFLSGIRIHISKKDFTADELYMIEKSGDYTHIRFVNKKLNEYIPQHMFDMP